MKYTLFALCLFISASSTAQIPLDSIYRDGAVWTQLYVYERWASSSRYNKAVVGYTTSINGDTTVGQVKYKKLYYTWKGGYSNSTDDGFQFIPASPPKYVGRIRLSDKTVFYTRDEQSANPYYMTGVEYRIYNFALKIGDSIGDSLNPQAVVSSIDSVQTSNGKYLKKYITGPFSNNYIIEGLGLFYGLIDILSLDFPLRYIHPLEYGLCFSSGDIFYHYKPSVPGVDWYLLEKCFDMNALTVSEVNSQKELTIYPNPSQSFFTLEGNCKAKEAKITIVNMLGMVMHTEVIPVENNYIKCKVSIDSLPNGIYQLLLNTNESQKTISLTKG